MTDSTTSRDLTSVLLGDKIVCVGYSKIFNKILDSLEIDAYLYHLKGKNNNYGHVRSLVCVNDDKYDVDGVYLFDTTWDSKTSECSKKYLYSYRYFAKTKEEFQKYDDSNELIDNNLLYLNPDFSENVINTLKSDDIADRLKCVGKVNHLRRLTKKHELFNGVLPYSGYIDTIDSNKLKNEIDEIVNCFYKKIPGETILKLLYNIRKYQYYENPEIYDFSLDTFFNIFINSDFTFTSMTPEERLCLAIFGEFDEVNHYRRNIIKYNNENELTKDIERVKLAKTLRKVYEKNK